MMIPMFALILAQANASNVIDYTTPTEVKIYNSAIAELPSKFNYKSKSVNMLCEKLIDRANEVG